MDRNLGTENDNKCAEVIHYLLRIKNPLLARDGNVNDLRRFIGRRLKTIFYRIVTSINGAFFLPKLW
jgi:hypothetical protein